MTHFKLVVVRKDGISHDSQFSGWHAETAMCRFFKEATEDKRTLVAVVYEGVQSPHSSDIQWTPRQSFKIKLPTS
jgi:hypothetical protein